MSVSRDKIAEGPWKTDSFPLSILLHISHVKDVRPKWAAGQFWHIQTVGIEISHVPSGTWVKGKKYSRSTMRWWNVKAGTKGEKEGKVARTKKEEKGKNSTWQAVCRGWVIFSAGAAQVTQGLLKQHCCLTVMVVNEEGQMLFWGYLVYLNICWVLQGRACRWGEVWLECCVSCCNFLSFLFLVQVVWAVRDAVAGWKWRCFLRIPAWCSGER